MRGRFLTWRLGNPAVIGKVNRRIVLTLPASRPHLMPEEGAHRDEESNAHNERGRQYRQVLQHGCTPSCLRLL